MTKHDILRQIRLKCLECSCGSSSEVDKCPVTKCELYELRFGKDPHPRELSEEEIERRRIQCLKNFGHAE